MFERFTHDARVVVLGATQVAHRFDSAAIAPEHLLIAMLDVGGPEAELLRASGLQPFRLESALAADGGDGLDADALGAIGIDLDEVRRQADRVFGPGALDGLGRGTPDAPGRGASRSRRVPFTAEAKKVLELALREAIRLGDREIRTGHLVLGLSRPRTASAELLRRCGAEPEAVHAAVLARREAA